MKANELRIGNHLDIITGKFRIVKSLYYNDQVGMDDGFTYFLSEVQPIKLTHDVIEKCGFDNHRGNEYIISITLDKHLSLTMMPDGVYPLLLADPEFSSGELQVISTNRIEYLHQLQNLYFALTGEELTVNL